MNSSAKASTSEKQVPVQSAAEMIDSAEEIMFTYE
jgi:hypothetical protein